MGVNNKRSYEYNYKIPNCELPRFIPAIKLKFVESEIGIDFDLAQSVLGIEIEEDSGAYVLVGICEDMNMTEVEGIEERKGIWEGSKVHDVDVKEMRKEMEGLQGVKDQENKESDARKEQEGKLGRRRN
ncbi:hypothetical protein BOTNAR_0429g00050 [Botryotinia narcissicola]|uniref:Uncharacterized protein n=1 Tax=Botryotinia narcissicola TaxID=278944 RepID=A0A4Z1HQA0_9HELO|nr:hypothetical protein BOTNAR_0429g00050 [Botryotinia narcissicola]